MASQTKANSTRGGLGDGWTFDEARQVLDETARALDRSARRLEQSTDETLTVGAVFSAGVALGLYLGGANRILVTLALVPTLAMAITLLERQGKPLTSA